MPRHKAPTPLDLYHEQWKTGCGNALCERAGKIVHVRGQLPCDVFFIGEAPGESEDAIGRPFVGPAGHLLDEVIERSLGHRTICKACQRGHMFGLDRFLGGSQEEGGEIWSCNNGHYTNESRPVRVALANLIGCIPRDEETGRKITDGPDAEEIVNCAPRLEQLLDMARPRLIICVGALARNWMKKGFKNPCSIPSSVKNVIDILHPAAILRGSVAQRGLSIQRCVAVISTAIEDLDDAPQKQAEPKPKPVDADDDIPF